MPARKRPTAEDAVTARQTLLDGLARNADIFQLLSELAPLHPRDNTFPGEVFLRVAATQHHNDHFGTQWERPSDDGTADHNAGSRATAVDQP